MYVYAYACVSICGYDLELVHTCKNLAVQACVCVCIHAYIHTCAQILICIHTHIYIHASHNACAENWQHSDTRSRCIEYKKTKKQASKQKKQKNKYTRAHTQRTGGRACTVIAKQIWIAAINMHVCIHNRHKYTEFWTKYFVRACVCVCVCAYCHM
jgi:hypothetical protein